jgi:hypothetical protein
LQKDLRKACERAAKNRENDAELRNLKATELRNRESEKSESEKSNQLAQRPARRVVEVQKRQQMPNSEKAATKTLILQL